MIKQIVTPGELGLSSVANLPEEARSAFEGCIGFIRGPEGKMFRIWADFGDGSFEEDRPAHAQSGGALSDSRRPSGTDAYRVEFRWRRQVESNREVRQGVANEFGPRDTQRGCTHPTGRPSHLARHPRAVAPAYVGVESSGQSRGVMTRVPQGSGNNGNDPGATTLPSASRRRVRCELAGPDGSRHRVADVDRLGGAAEVLRIGPVERYGLDAFHHERGRL